MKTRPSRLPDSIRSSVNSVLGPDGPTDNPLLNHRIVRTKDAAGRWFSRADLYGHLCQTHCEPVAQRRVLSLTPRCLKAVSLTH